ncbi:hypothetical protein GA0070606_0556 [Micromonospora citrea]|uniref:GDSL-like Lipase/Acylhydrolase family protein n=1 Tax=Micromonospora citrea TaxID=47855 RepID=A0A1C6TT83_9ACTN|nr:hypothetical protein [Micromonospora citrea]SCL45005.1 hypothetical protein GA0070606_0556 [Micromonospora citrea]
MSYSLRKLQTVAIGLGLVLGMSSPASATDQDAQPTAAQDHWVGTWSASASGTVPNLPTGYSDRTVRNVVHTSVGGSGVRVWLSNALGTVAVRMDAVTIAVADAPDAPEAVAGTMRALAFGGAPSVTIPAGGKVLSDPIPLAVPEDGDLLVSVYTPTSSGPVTYHQVANQTSYLSRNGDHAADESGSAFTETIGFWPYVSGVDVLGQAECAVVTLGDSITDGNNSTRNANHR